MTDIKLVSWNIEHMHKWFADTQANVVRALRGVARKCGAVLDAMEPDILCVQEGPNRIGQMRSFMRNFVTGGGQYEVVQGQTGGTQRSYLLYRGFPGLQFVELISFDAAAWKYDFIDWSEIHSTFSKKRLSFTRLPVEVIFHTTGGAFSAMCLHVKSKISKNVGNVRSSNAKKRTKAIATALEQRARILQEGRLLRDYVQGYPFANTVNRKLVIAGDLNDGPGRGFFEHRYFGTDLLRQIRGDIDHSSDVLTNTVDQGPESQRFSAVFNDRVDLTLRRLLLDHILVTPEMQTGTPRVLASTATVEHAAYLAENEGDWTKKKKPSRTRYPSDHRPVSITIRF